MSYCEYPPHALLSSSVACYWSSKTVTPKTQVIFPDGCTDIIFDFQGERSSISAVGIMTTSITVNGIHDAFGIRFRAGAMNSIFRQSMFEFADDSVAIQNDTIFPDGLKDKMITATNAERVNLIDAWLLKSIQRPDRITAWQWCIDQIQLRHGNISIRELTRESSLSEKQLERKLLQQVGVTPKQFSTIIRFCEAKRRLENKKASLETLAWDLGYTDHAHFTKSFKGFAGITPSAYRMTR